MEPLPSTSKCESIRLSIQQAREKVFENLRSSLSDIIRILEFYTEAYRGSASLSTPTDWIKSVQEFDELEEQLKWDTKKRQKVAQSLCERVSTVESVNLKQHVLSTLKLLFSSKLVRKLKWKGKSGSLYQTEIIHIFFEVIRQKFSDATNYEIERHVKKWLKTVGQENGNKQDDGWIKLRKNSKTKRFLLKLLQLQQKRRAAAFKRIREKSMSFRIKRRMPRDMRCRKGRNKIQIN